MFDDAPIDQAVEGIVNGIFFNQGHVCCAGSRLLVQESVHDAVLDRLKRRLGTLRLGDPLDKNTDIGAINSAAQLARITELVAAGEAEGAERWQPPCDAARRGLLVRPDRLHRTWPRATASPARRSSGRCCRCSPSARRTRRVAKANNTPYGLSAGVWTEKGSRILWMAQRLRAGVVWANTFNRFDPTSPFGGYKESGFGREGGRHGLGAYLQRADALMADRLDVRKTYKLYVGGEVPALGERSLVRGRRRQGPVPGQRGAGLAQGRPRRRGRGPRRASPAGRARPPTTAARCCTGWPRCWRAGGTQFVGRGRRRPRGSRPGPPAAVVDAAIDRWVWYAGWSDKFAQVDGAVEPGRRARTSTSRCPSRPAWSPCVAPQASSLLGPGVGGGAGHRERQHAAWWWRRRTARCRRSRWARCWPPPTCPAASSTCSPATSAELAPPLASHLDVNALDLDRRRRPRAGRRRSRSRRPRT